MRYEVFAPFLLLLTLTSPAQAGPNANANVVLHIAESVTADPCLSSSRIPSCSEIWASEVVLGVPLYVYLLVLGGDAHAGVGAVSLGITYDNGPDSGIHIHSWTLCGDQQTGFGWPASDSGLLVSWNANNCQHRWTGIGDPYLGDTGAAVVGYFYCTPYTPSRMMVQPEPSSGAVSVTDCAGVVDNITNLIPSHLGQVGFGGETGYNPCWWGESNYPCTITGPDQVAAGSTGVHYSASPVGNVHNFWDISGSGTIVGSSEGTSVTVQPGEPGTFRLYFTGVNDPSPPNNFCYKTVIVTDATPALITSWSRIKTLYRD